MILDNISYLSLKVFAGVFFSTQYFYIEITGKIIGEYKIGFVSKTKTTVCR